MTCTCENATTIVSPGADTAQARTVVIAAGATETIDSSNSGRRSLTIGNQSAGAIVVSFGATYPVSGGGPGITLNAGQSLTIATTAEVHVLNPQAVQAQLAYLTEQD